MKGKWAHPSMSGALGQLRLMMVLFFFPKLLAGPTEIKGLNRLRKVSWLLQIQEAGEGRWTERQEVGRAETERAS